MGVILVLAATINLGRTQCAQKLYTEKGVKSGLFSRSMTNVFFGCHFFKSERNWKRIELLQSWHWYLSSHTTHKCVCLELFTRQRKTHTRELTFCMNPAQKFLCQLIAQLYTSVWSFGIVIQKPFSTYHCQSCMKWTAAVGTQNARSRVGLFSSVCDTCRWSCPGQQHVNTGIKNSWKVVLPVILKVHFCMTQKIPENKWLS